MEFSKMWVTPVLLAVALISLASGLCEAGEFTADRITLIDYSKAKDKELRDVPLTRVKAKLYVKGDSERSDLPKMVMTKDRKTGTSWPMPLNNSKPDRLDIWIRGKGIYRTVKPRLKTYSDHYIHTLVPGPQFKGWKYLGKTPIKGYECKKYTRSRDPETGLATETWWWSSKLGYQIRTELLFRDGHLQTEELTNIVEKRMPDSTFGVPRGYRKVPAQHAAP